MGTAVVENVYLGRSCLHEILQHDNTASLYTDSLLLLMSFNLFVSYLIKYCCTIISYRSNQQWTEHTSQMSFGTQCRGTEGVLGGYNVGRLEALLAAQPKELLKMSVKTHSLLSGPVNSA